MVGKDGDVSKEQMNQTIVYQYKKIDHLNKLIAKQKVREI